MTRSSDYQPYLNNVSRSFSFCIEQLNEPFRHQIGLSYLLLRILDTIEDSSWPTLEIQLETFQTFLRSVDGSEKLPLDWPRRFPESVSKGELELIEITSELIDDLHAWDQDSQKILLDNINEMAKGMQYFLKRDSGKIILRDQAETDKYCYYVAGTVGESIYRFQLAASPELQFSRETLKLAHLNGITLQRANILKDRYKDRKVGYSFFKDQDELLESFYRDFPSAFAFCRQLPENQVPLRQFALWPIFIALGTIRKIMTTDKNSSDEIKLNRSETTDIILHVSNNINSPTQLEYYMDEFTPSKESYGTPTVR